MGAVDWGNCGGRSFREVHFFSRRQSKYNDYRECSLAGHFSEVDYDDGDGQRKLTHFRLVRVDFPDRGGYLFPNRPSNRRFRLMERCLPPWTRGSFSSGTVRPPRRLETVFSALRKSVCFWGFCALRNVQRTCEFPWGAKRVASFARWRNIRRRPQIPP